MPAQDALFDAPGTAGVLLQELKIVIRFQEQNICRAHPVDDQLGGMAKVGKEPDVPGAGAQEESYRIIRIVR